MDISKLKLVRIADPIFRANKSTFRVGLLASNNYRNAPMKYFTLNEKELSAYTKYGKPYKKKWQPTEELVLIDILDLSTRKALEEMIGSESLNIAFPITGNKVSRVSEEHTRIHDDNVLRAICALDDSIDGYYMKRLTKKDLNNEGQNKYVFHSEVGLCPRAFSKLRLESVQRSLNDVPIRKRTRRNRNNNNNNISNIRKTKRRRINLGTNELIVPQIKRLSLI
jgi:hypothetical protein